MKCQRQRFFANVALIANSSYPATFLSAQAPSGTVSENNDIAIEEPDLEVLNCEVLLATIQPQQKLFDGNSPPFPGTLPGEYPGGDPGGGVKAIPAPQARRSMLCKRQHREYNTPLKSKS